MKKTPMTLLGEEQLRKELHLLKTETRPKLIAAIAEARAHGDLRENDEYHAAREQQSFSEGRIAEIEHKLASAQVIDISKTTVQDGRVVFGTTIELRDVDSNQELRYQIVGEDEADTNLAKISFNSPIGRALIGKYESDIVEVSTPSRQRHLEIIKVEYA